jgi:hypothetical protein
MTTTRPDLDITGGSIASSPHPESVDGMTGGLRSPFRRALRSPNAGENMIHQAVSPA